MFYIVLSFVIGGFLFLNAIFCLAQKRSRKSLSWINFLFAGGFVALGVVGITVWKNNELYFLLTTLGLSVGFLVVYFLLKNKSK